MSKATVSRLFIGGLLAAIAGAIVAIAAVWIGIANDVFVVNGPDIVGLRGSALAWTLVGFGAAGGLAVVAGATAGFVASIGALANAWRLESKAWFVALLVLGIFSLGFFAMVAWILAGPDGTGPAGARKATASPAASAA